jgi:hypothetical protein
MPHIKEGDFVMGATTEGLIHGMVEHIMIEGGTLGTPGSRYALESKPPENPAMSVRIYKEENDNWEPTAYSIGMMHADAQKIDIKEHEMDAEETMKSYHSDDEEMDKWDNVAKACWVGYEQRGMKEKGGRMVPNCVPVGKMDEMDDDVEKAKSKYEDVIKPRSGGSSPSNPKLYATVVQAAKDKFDIYPSAYANAWVVAEYKRRGGMYKLDSQKTTKSIWDGSFDPKGFTK